MGIATTGFCHPGGILQLFHRQDQQILRLLTAATVRSHLADQSSLTVFIIKKYAQIGRSNFFGWFSTNPQIAIRLRVVFLHQFPDGS
jgi:hypothetical protein